MAKYIYEDYNPKYKRQFSEQKRILKKVLPDYAKIEHVGSTAVPGLGGKGIIDIVIEVPYKKIKTTKNKLEKIGFEYRKSHIGDKKRKFFQKIIKHTGKERRIHIHLTYPSSGYFDSFVRFRDYLRNNKKDMSEYAKVKKEAAKKAKEDGIKYANHKMKVLRKILKASKGI